MPLFRSVQIIVTDSFINDLRTTSMMQMTTKLTY